tara:strand:+ start:5562 stop:5903 length:342 start_codon:yes stop_codon:yes gene_type:complete
MSAYKRFEMWLNGNCPNCKERKLEIIRLKRPMHYQYLNCDSKYYYPYLWQLPLFFIAMFFPRTILDALNLTTGSVGSGLRLTLIFFISMSCFAIGFSLLPKKPYIVDEEKVIK